MSCPQACHLRAASPNGAPAVFWHFHPRGGASPTNVDDFTGARDFSDATPEGLPGVLRSTPLFSAFSEADLDTVCAFSRRTELAAKEVLFHEGESCHAVYCVVSGLLKLYVCGPEKREKALSFIPPGRTLGETALFSGQGYVASAMALQDTSVVAINAFSLLRFLRQHTELSWQILAVMSRRLHYAVDQVRSVTLHSAEQRLAAFLLDNHDPDEPGKAVTRLPVRRSDLASILGVTTETLCRVVARFRREGWILTADHDILVREPEALQGLLTQPRRQVDG